MVVKGMRARVLIRREKSMRGEKMGMVKKVMDLHMMVTSLTGMDRGVKMVRGEKMGMDSQMMVMKMEVLQEK